MKLSNTLFAGHLDEGEKILDVAHRHVFVFVKNSFKTLFFGILIPISLYLFFPQAIVFALLWFGVGFLGMLYHFIDWYFDAWLLTNVGVIDIERHGLFERNSTRVDYHMVEGVSYEINGFVPTVLNFGNMTLDKLGTQTSLVLKDATNPKKVERILMKYQDRFAREKSFRDHHALKDMLSEMIAYHVQNNGKNG